MVVYLVPISLNVLVISYFFDALALFQLINITTQICQIKEFTILTRQDLSLYYFRTNTTVNSIIK